MKKLFLLVIVAISTTSCVKEVFDLCTCEVEYTVVFSDGDREYGGMNSYEGTCKEAKKSLRAFGSNPDEVFTATDGRTYQYEEEYTEHCDSLL